MIARAEIKYIRISPSKLRQIIDIVRGQKANAAVNLLGVLNKKGADCLEKALKSAIANAKSKGYEEDKLIISKLLANPGPMLKRFRAASFGRATTIRKRTSHILVELDTPERIVGKMKAKG